MLNRLFIRDFVIVDALELEFQPGMTVITGETGAGKSIVVDAVGLALGERADSAFVRSGSGQAEIVAEFDLAHAPEAAAWLQEQALAGDGECLVRRVISGQGRSKAWINARPVPIQQLQELGDRLVDIHGQHEHQSLLRRAQQRELLDAFADHAGLRREVAELAAQWRRTRDESLRLQGSNADRAARAELLRYQVRELEELDLRAGELEELDREQLRLAHAEQLLQVCQRAQQLLYENDEAAVHSLIAHTAAELAPFCAIDPRIAEAHELLTDCAIQVQEASHSVRDAAEATEVDPERLQAVDARLALVQDLARKHRVDPEALTELLGRLRNELAALEGAGADLQHLEAELARLSAAYATSAARLSASRQKAAAKLAATVTERMQGLAMAGGQFDVALQALDGDEPSPLGLEQVEFLVSANPGQPLRPLTKVASGGELSRISLAIQVVTTRSARIPTLIFDEVDVGIGGGVAETVGSLLRQLGQTRQVLCVTHLPQVAALGHHHMVVTKHSDRTSTRAEIAPLAGPDRIQELARMLGGTEITAQTEAHAREMIERWQEA